jgi:two-component system sensor histidine kinase HydH
MMEGTVYSPMPLSRYRWARWGLFGSTVLLGAALVVTAWIGRERAAGAAAIINQGQGETWLESVRQVVGDFDAGVDSRALDLLLARRREAGLQGISVYDSSGLALVHVGDTTAAPLERLRGFGPRPLSIEQKGARFQLTGVAFVGRPGSAGGRPRPVLVVMTFIPVAARQLLTEATGTLVLSSVVAAALFAAALLFWRLVILHENAERRLEQQKRLSMLGEMSAVLAHEIRNPLASLKGHAQLLVERLGEANPDGTKAQLVVSEAERLEALINDLLGFARSGPIDIQPTDPAALLRQCTEEIGRDGFAIKTDHAPASWPLDPNRMRQALTNVLRNARQASAGATRPEVAVVGENGRLVFTVRDFGPGITAGDEQRIFEPFYTTRTSGTGLGLAVAARIAGMHGGVISVRNHPDGGAVFTIAVPKGPD